MLDFNGKMKALNGGNPFMKSTEKDRERGAATLGEWKRRRTEILSNPPLTITSLLCIEDAFETYLPASMNPSENVISKARKKTGFLSRTVCRFHKSVNCLSESSQIQTETWLFVWRVVSEVTFRKCKYLCDILKSDLYLTYKRSVGKWRSNIMCSVKFTISMDLWTIKILDSKRDASERSLRRTIKLNVYSAINSEVLTISTTDLLNRTKWVELRNTFGQILSRPGSHPLYMGFKEPDGAVGISFYGFIKKNLHNFFLQIFKFIPYH